jgi:cobalamin-dependent methionine synthase I
VVVAKKNKKMSKRKEETLYYPVEPLIGYFDGVFVNIGGTACSVPRKFLRLIQGKKYDEALSIAKSR